MTRASSLGSVDPALVERMVALVLRLHEGFFMLGANDKGISAYDAVAEARAIAALLPEPVDPDLVEARDIAASSQNWSADYAEQIIAGDLDSTPAVRVALAAIKRGRQLAQPDASNEA